MARHVLSIALMWMSFVVACEGGQTGELFRGEGGKATQRPDAGNEPYQMDGGGVGDEGGTPDAASEGGFKYERFVELRSDLQRESSPSIADTEVAELIRGNSEFAFELYRHLTTQHTGRNLIFSPYSISVALAMTYAGAENETERQMAEALRFALPEPQLYAAFNKTDLLLSDSVQAAATNDSQGFRFNLVNSIWGQKDTPLEGSFLDHLAVNFDSGLRLVDFVRDPERAREIINQWVLGQSEQGFKELLPQGSIAETTRMVLVNALYFKARWFYRFEKLEAFFGDFTSLSGQTMRVTTMLRSSKVGFYQGDGYAAIEVHYQGDQLSMVVLLPDSGRFESFESGLDARRVQEAVAGLSEREITLSIPSWKTDAPSISLKQVLGEMGMTDAFDVTRADFSGMDGARDLSISDIYHKVWVDVNETGTEAAVSSSQSLVDITSFTPTIDLHIDRPFVFLIRDVETNTILFLGRVIDPNQGAVDENQ